MKELNTNMETVKKVGFITVLITAILLFLIGLIIRNPDIPPESKKQTQSETIEADTKIQQLKTSLKIISPYYGGTVVLNLEEKIEYLGKINTIQEGDDYTTIGGSFDDGTFFFNITEDGTTSGYVFHSMKTAYVLDSCKLGEEIVFQKKDIKDIICISPSPVVLGIEERGTPINAFATGDINSGTITTGSVNSVPVYDSNLTAKVQLYIDFNGGYVQEPYWNGGKPFTLTPSGLNQSQMQVVLDILSQRFASFGLNVTTDKNKFISAKAGYKQRVYLARNIPSTVVPSNFAGIAPVRALALMRTGQIPNNTSCYVDLSKYNGLENAAESVAHELGHTLGLTHDGTKTSTYFKGQGNWGAVMGASFNLPVVQFSNGDYLNANNNQDDITLIATNIGVGYRSLATNYTAFGVQGAFTHTDYIVTRNTSKAYTFDTASGGTLFVSVKTPEYTSLKPAVEVINKTTNKVLFTSNPSYGEEAIIMDKVPRGTYLIKIYGTGEGDPLKGGYSNYGSIGKFTIRGTVPKDGTFEFGKSVPIMQIPKIR